MASETLVESSQPTANARRRAVAVAGTVVFAAIGLYTAYTAGSLLANELLGQPGWSGAPGAAAILGTAAGAAVLSAVMARAGRRRGLLVGWAVGVLGAAVGVVAVAAGLFFVAVGAMVLIGFGNGATQLARYAAADGFPAHRRGAVVSLVVWAVTLGAAAGPVLLELGAALARAFGLAELSGSYLVATTAFTLAAVGASLVLGPDPVRDDPVQPDQGRAAGAGWDRLTILAVLALVAAQFVMVLVMTVTPAHMRGHHHSLAPVGIVLSAHVLGMFGFAPVFGWLTDRLGPLRMTLAGLVTVAVASAAAAVASPSSVPLLGLALFTLGLGWSAAFVASSTLATRCTPVVQGRIEALSWSCAAAAAVVGGLILGLASYLVVCLVGIAVTAAAIAVVAPAGRRRVVSLPTHTG